MEKIGALPDFFPGAVLEHNHAGKLRYTLPLSVVSLASVFELMEARKDGLGILDYSCSQPSLESIFLAIAEKDINRKPVQADAPTGGEQARAADASVTATEL